MLNMVLFSIIFAGVQAITSLALMKYFSSERFMAKTQERVIKMIKRLEDEYEDLV